ncbi:MAG: hypothetical protein IKT52_10935 [Oscillospiraceae bacterium]|nr:hypothetical protein [Oscillospiraceae bacterium]
MVNIQGLYKFRDFFQNYTDKYVIIGGSACSIVFDEVGGDFRVTKDLDIVLIVENINEEFGRAFWDFIKEAKYKRIETGEKKNQFYRFERPEDTNYPHTIELFSRNPDVQLLPEAHLTPMHISDDISSLSAILLDDDYYDFLLNGRRILDGFSVLDEKYLIPFKVKAWCELSTRRKDGEKGQSKHIRKHYRDVYHLLMLLPPNERVELPELLKADMQVFIDGIKQGENKSDDIDNDLLCRRLEEIYLSI